MRKQVESSSKLSTFSYFASAFVFASFVCIAAYKIKGEYSASPMQMPQCIIAKVTTALGVKLCICCSQEMLPFRTVILSTVVKIVAITFDHSEGFPEIFTILYSTSNTSEESLPISTSKMPRKINPHRMRIRYRNRKVNV